MLIAYCSQDSSLWRDLLILLLGVLLGGMMNLIVERARVLLRRRKISEALLPYLRECCKQAADLNKTLSTDMIPNWERGQCAIYSFRGFDTTVWQSLLQDIDQLRPKYWPALVRFHSQISSVQFSMDFLQQAQSIFQRSAEAQPLGQAEGIKKRIIERAKSTAQECEHLGMCASATGLEEFRKRWGQGSD
jgi:hypothetical protein